MKVHIVTALTAVILTMMLASCGGDVTTPRRKAYPRIEIADSSFQAVRDIPLNFEANSAAIIQPDTTGRVPTDGSAWLNLKYSLYGDATIFVTFTPINSDRQLGEVLDNRFERMAMNSGGNTSERIEFSNPHGFENVMLVTRAGTVTPVQFVSYDGRWVVTGAFYMNDINASSADSVSPVIEGVKRDIIHALRNLYVK